MNVSLLYIKNNLTNPIWTCAELLKESLSNKNML